MSHRPSREASDPAAAQPLDERDLFKWFRQFVIGLQVVCSDGGQLDTTVLSGFILKHEDLFLWVTAGHCIEELKRLKSRCANVGLQWLDEHPNKKAPSLFVDYDSLIELSFSRNDDQLDVGIVVLRPLWQKAFDSNPAKKWLPEPAWRPVQDGCRIRDAFLIGYPHECMQCTEKLVTKAGHRYVRGTSASCYLRVEVIPPRDSDEYGGFWRKNRIYGRVRVGDDSDGALRSVEGMSGGPLCVIFEQPDGLSSIRVLGIQSAWVQSVQIVSATPFDQVANAVEIAAQRIREQTQDNPPSGRRSE